MTTHSKLRLLSGPLAGRELNLPAGPFTIGSGEHDLVLALDAGADATLEVDDQTVRLTSATPCWIDGRPAGPGPLPAGSVIDLAGVHFVLGQADATLAQLPLVARIGARRWPAVLAGVSALAALAALAGAVWCWHPPAPAPAPRTWLPALLAEHSGLHARWLADDRLQLSGRCRASADLAPLLARLRTAGVHLRQETVCDDDLLYAVQAQLASHGYPKVAVSITADAVALLDGTLRDDASLAALSDALDQMPGLRGWQVTDQSATELTELIDSLSVAKLLTGVSATHGPLGWVLTAQLDPVRQQALQRLIEQRNAGAGLNRPLRLMRARNDAGTRDYLPAALSGIGGNAQAPFAELANGTRLQLGSAALKDMHVIAIDASGISLSDGHRLIFLELRA